MIRNNGLVWLAILLGAGCSQVEREGAPGNASLVVYLEPQEHQVATVARSAAEIPDDELEPGWSVLSAPREHAPVWALVGRDAFVRFMAVDAGERLLEVEARWLGDAAARLGLALNDRRLQAIELRPGRHRYRVRLPATAMRFGANRLRFQPRDAAMRSEAAGDGSGEEVRFAVLGLRWLSSAGEPRALPARPKLGVDPERGLIEMPNESWFDVVELLPPEARLRSRLRVGFEGELPSPDPLRVSIERVGEEGAPEMLFEREFSAAASEELDVPVGTAVEEWTRLRFVVRGRAPAVVRWVAPELVGIGPEAAPQPLEEPSVPPGSNLLLVVLDAARADAFSTYGGPYPSPAMETLAQRGTLFERAIAPSSWTGQSIPSLLSGRSPAALGIGHWGDRVAPDVPLLAERAASAGYRTALWSQHPFYRWHEDLRRGFDAVHVVGSGAFDVSAWSETLSSRGEPWFEFVHLLPPHAPYEPPPPFRGRRSSWYRGDLEPEAKLLNALSDGRVDRELCEDDVRYVRDRYLEHAEYADSLLGGLLAAFERAGALDRTVVVVTSDHGEGFFEHGRFLHTRELYDEFVRVPLLIAWAGASGGAPARIESPITLSDVAPTLARVLGLEHEDLSPRSLFVESAVFTTTRGDTSRDRRARPNHAVELDGWKAIYRPLTDATELYFLPEDPGERRDLTPARPRRAEYLRQEIRRWLVAEQARVPGSSSLSADPGSPGLSDEERAELEALGYIN